MSASVKSLLNHLTSPGPHRVRAGNLAVAGQPGVVFTPERGTDLPAVAFGHGWLSGAGSYVRLLRHLASWGFVAAAPDSERGPVPSHLNLAGDLLTTLDICTGVRLGDGQVTVHPERVALAGHGMGAGAAVIAAAQRPVGAVAALYPAPTAPAAEPLAEGIDTPALIVAGESDIASVNGNAIPLARAWAGPVVLRTVDNASHNGMVAGRRILATLGAGKHEPRTERITRALLVGYLTYQLLGDKAYEAFADPEAKLPHTSTVDPAPAEAEIEAIEDESRRLSGRQVVELVQLLRK
ncbi:alpha/beta hydrolase [Nocardia aurantia]|uniref:PET hydrolase/cutinase-like domain-containing protein n=1 Tax=Nocardia aurantia TaxID=2585199 RepID=A0A7K0DHI8_9NOCA|nr:dienelactone hydrolase family protein [Nocardia aurantia]MQY25078.1 hypothetical protein [Nocardia aurantia]